MSTAKVEQKAVNAVISMICDSKYLTADEIKVGDRSVSLDGAIPVYSKIGLTKKDFEGKIDVQIKGKTCKNLSVSKNLSFSINRLDLKNFNKVGGVIFFYVQEKENSSETRIYYKVFLPYEINKILLEHKGDTISVKFHVLNNSDELLTVCNQFLEDSSKQSSFKDVIKVVDDFINKPGKFVIGMNFSNSININDDDLFDKESFVYFEPDEYKDVKIPCGIAKLKNISRSKNYIIDIGGNKYDVTIELVNTADGRIININDCISYKEHTKTITFLTNGLLSKIKTNINIIIDFIKYKKISIDKSSIRLLDPVNDEVHQRQLKVLDMLSNILKYYELSFDPCVDFDDSESIKNIFVLYEYIFNKKGIPYKSTNDSFIYKINIFDLSISLLAKKRDDGGYDIQNVKDIIFSSKPLFLIPADKDTPFVLYPNISIFQPVFSLEPSYLCSDNILPFLSELEIDYNKINNDETYMLIFQMFIMGLVSLYDKNNNTLLFNFIKKITSELFEINSNSINLINYCQMLKRSNELSELYINSLIFLKDSSSDYTIKFLCSRILDDDNSSKLYYSKMSSDEKEKIDMYLS